MCGAMITSIGPTTPRVCCSHAAMIGGRLGGGSSMETSDGSGGSRAKRKRSATALQRIPKCALEKHRRKGMILVKGDVIITQTGAARQTRFFAQNWRAW